MWDFEIVLMVIVIVLVAIIFYLLSKVDNKKNEQENEWLRLLQKQIHSMNKNIDFKLAELNRGNQKQWEVNANISRDATKTLTEITKKITELEQTNKDIKQIWWQLQGLEDILKNPKQRGILWEYFLESILKNILPPENYQLQYKFRTNEIVDAVIFIDTKIIPVDSKFSLENYQNILDAQTKEEKNIFIKKFKSDLKTRIDETSKYIKPTEWTMDFAFMFIPSEAIYYDLLINKIGTIQANTTDLIEYAFKEKKVIIISPTSFYAYLQTVLQWLKALQIEQQAEEIKQQIEKLGKHLQAYEVYLEKLGNTLGTTVNHYNTAYQKFNLIEKDIFQITSEQTEIKKIEVERPLSLSK